MVIKKKSEHKRTIDLTGPQGNAYCLLGTAQSLLRQLGRSEKDIKIVLDEMKSSDYENLIKVFDKEFGHFITLYR